MVASVKVESLTAGYGATTIIRDVSFSLDSGECLAVIGRNGMGKTTLLKTLLGYLPGARGSVQIQGRESLGAPTYQLVRRGLSYAPQEAAIFSNLTVRDNLASARKPSPAGRRRLAWLFEFFPVLAERLDQKAGTLSGGEQKMLILTRALLPEPEVLLVDEISDGLQPKMVSTVRDVLVEERRERGTTMLIVEQNIDLSFAIADRVAVLKLGQIAFECPPEAESRPEVLLQLAP